MVANLKVAVGNQSIILLQTSHGVKPKKNLIAI